MPQYKLLLYLRVGIGDTKQRFSLDYIFGLNEGNRISFGVIEDGSLYFVVQFILVHFERKSLLMLEDKVLPLVLGANFGEFFPADDDVGVFVNDNPHIFAFNAVIMRRVLV
jgi:hypothetical protein